MKISSFFIIFFLFVSGPADAFELKESEFEKNIESEENRQFEEENEIKVSSRCNKLYFNDYEQNWYDIFTDDIHFKHITFIDSVLFFLEKHLFLNIHSIFNQVYISNYSGISPPYSV